MSATRTGESSPTLTPTLRSMSATRTGESSPTLTPIPRTMSATRTGESLPTLTLTPRSMSATCWNLSLCGPGGPTGCDRCRRPAQRVPSGGACAVTAHGRVTWCVVTSGRPGRPVGQLAFSAGSDSCSTAQTDLTDHTYRQGYVRSLFFVFVSSALIHQIYILLFSNVFVRPDIPQT